VSGHPNDKYIPNEYVHRALAAEQYLAAAKAKIAELEAQLAEREWRPIESVPKNTDVLMWVRGALPDEQWLMEADDEPIDTSYITPRIVMGKHQCAYSGLCTAVLWQPLPHPPKEAPK